MGQAETKIIRIENHGMTRIGKKKCLVKKFKLFENRGKTEVQTKAA